MFCHILIGCPSSGKTTLAEAIVEDDPSYKIVSTDKIREKLFGDETIQGNWSQIEAEVFRQLEGHLKAGHPVIYDATNAKRPWRMGLLRHLKQYQTVDWLGWYVKTPLGTCLQWNQTRERQVPEGVIKRMSESLKTFPPMAAEGFASVYELNPKLKTSLSAQFKEKLSNFSRSVVNRHNRTQKITRHAYSNLVDFERLMYLIHLLLKYPGIGNLQETSPETVEQIVGDGQTSFATEVDEICAFIAKIADPIYANPSAIKSDLNWLEENGLIGKADINADLKISIKEDSESPTHSYSDLEPFQRLIKTIRLITHEPFIWKKELGGTLNSLMERMKKEQMVDENARDSLRKDIEKVLKPYQILPEFPMKRGYFAGTAILSEQDLGKVFQLLETQAKSFDDPVALQIYETFKRRMEMAKLVDSESYPVRGVHHPCFVEPKTLSESSLAENTKEVESAIAQGKLLELERSSCETQEKSLFKAYPLQMVFHNLAWYLGFEYSEGEEKGLLQFERLDQLGLGQVQEKARSRSTQLKSLNRLITLYKSSGGIFLGNDPKIQQQYLSSDATEREKVEVMIEIWLTNEIFSLISEGTQPFPRQQMKMSLPLNRHLLRKNRSLFNLRKTSHPNFPHRFRVYLPQWSLSDVDLHNWILGFGGQAKVVSPNNFRETLQEKGEAVVKALTTENSNQQ